MTPKKLVSLESLGIGKGKEVTPVYSFGDFL
jgi:hypothetical protein